jgi:hypothetical protein
MPNANTNNEQICIGCDEGQIQLYSIQQQQQQINCKLIQTFPQEHSSSYSITSIIQINPNTLISSPSAYSSPSDNVIVIWSKSKSLFRSSLEYEPVQRITPKETGGGGIWRLVLINQKKEEEEQFASCSPTDHSVLIWRRRGKGDKFQIKQKITNVKGVCRLLYISQTNELIFESYPSPLLQIWSPSSSSSSNFVEKQKIETSSCIYSLCQLNDSNRNRIEFASGHSNGQIMIWSKQINESNYSLSKTLQPFNNDHLVWDLIFINYNEGFNHFLISCSGDENKIVIYKGEGFEEEEELEHKRVSRLIPMSNGQFASGGWNQCLNIWTPSSSSSLSS